MDEDAADGPGRPDTDWDDLTPAIERVGSDANSAEPAEASPSDADDADDAAPTDTDQTDDSADDATSETPDESDDPDELAEAVIQADEASWHPDDIQSPTDESDAESVEGAADESTDEAADESAEWSDLEPATERVAPTPAVERVAPVPAVERIEDEDDAGIDAVDSEDFKNPAANIGQPDTIGDEPTAEPPGRQGPPDDAEQPLAVHIEEMVKRLGIVVAVAGAVSLALFPLTGEVINFLWYSILPGTDVAAPHVYHPLEYKLTQLKVASLGGLLIALPVFVYQTYRFMRPGLYPHERRYYLASVPTSLILGLLGVTFAYFVVLPAIMSYFLYYSQTVVTIAFALGATFDLILLLMGYLAVVFQIPLFVMLAIMMGLTTRQWLEDRRLIFWGAFLGVAFLFSPDPTGMAPVLVAATMVVLFEGTLLLLRWTGR